MKVVVYLIRDVHEEDHRKRVQKMFRHENFTVIAPDIPYKEDVVGYNTQEAYQIGWCLADSRENYPKQPVIVLKDSSMCLSGSNTIYNVVSEALNNNDHNFDVCYLCKWKDKCHFYTNRQQISKTSYSLVKTRNAHGCQALMFTPQGRDIILGVKPMRNGEFFKGRVSFDKTLHTHVANGSIIASTISPNLFTYNLGLAVNDEDFLKVNECDAIHLNKASKSPINYYVAVLILVILFALIVWAAICVSPQ